MLVGGMDDVLYVEDKKGTKTIFQAATEYFVKGGKIISAFLEY